MDEFLGKVRTLKMTSRAEAVDNLRQMLVEGVFIYFFAKFCHGPTFKIKVVGLKHLRKEPMSESCFFRYRITNTPSLCEASSE